MIKFNRIGKKLGLAGAVGVLLSVGMVANQLATESSINAANQRAETQQGVADNVLIAQIAMREMMLASRSIRLAKTPAEVEENANELQKASVDEQRGIDAAREHAVNPDNRERLRKIKLLMNDYAVGAGEIVKAQVDFLALIEKRNAVAAEWAKAFEAQRTLLALVKFESRHEIEELLLDADARMNRVRAAAWRFAATEEESQKQAIARDGSTLREILGRVRGLPDDKAFQAGLDGLDSIVKNYLIANDEFIKIGELKADLANRIKKLSSEAGELMQTTVSAVRKLTGETKAAEDADMAQANRIGLILALVVMLSLIGSVVFSFIGIARPMTLLNGALGKMAAGHLDIVIPGADRGDEVGDLAKTVALIRSNAEQKARGEAEAKIKQDQVAARQRKADMTMLANDFEAAVGEIIETVSSASSKLEVSAGTLTKTAERTQEITTTVAASSEEASSNVQSVASASEELASSVNEICRQVQESARVANEAVDQARKTNDRVGELSKAAARIGDVVELINTIAGQTNLLALNATIEAARAGEAGRGFAVVASEVKALAEQTAKATGEIGQQIAGIQAATAESVNAIKDISGTIEKLSEISSTIAAAVEEQGAATQEISRNVQQAALGTQQVSSNIVDVQRGAGETGSASSQVLSAAQSLSRDSNRLKLEVGKFLNSVRAA